MPVILVIPHSKYLETLCIAWGKGLRHVWDLRSPIPYRAQSNILSPLCSCLPMYDEICKRTANFIIQCLNSDCALVSRRTHHGIYFISSERDLLLAEMHDYAVKGTMYSIFKWSVVPARNWYNSTITESFFSGIQVLIDMIFIGDGSFDISGNVAPLYSRDGIKLFISIICTSGV